MENFRSLKNWFVGFESIKTSSTIYEKYLLSQQRHPGETITKISKNSSVNLNIDLLKYNDTLEDPDTFQDIYDKKREVWYKRKRKKSKNNGYEVVISLPPEIEGLEKIDFQKLYKEVMTKYFEWFKIENDLQINVNKLVQNIVCIQHKDNHLHMIIPTIDPDSLQYLDHSFKKCSYITKNILSEYLKTNHNITKENYLINQDKVQPKKSLKQARSDKHKEALNILNNEVKEYEEKLTTIQLDLLEKLHNIQVLFEKNKSKMKEEDIKKVEKYISTTDKQIKNNNTQRGQKTLDKIQNSLKTQNQDPSVW